ncbi:oligopeptide transporter 7 [Cinnamomum micranthum f. kanehirae]|uniref:Oligopeptide transporter 7 n=1 Tax=Cinnamomum micranthum f. kanehirae TaxID=337451 RepID=A0A443PF63_9MAGN|nr:oligopeptide transporter 7 [Cinnamomum micranthum f. kanehirae]
MAPSTGLRISWDGSRGGSGPRLIDQLLLPRKPTFQPMVRHCQCCGWHGGLDSVPNICNRDLIPPNSPSTCPGEHVFYDASVIWGLIEPRRIFGDLGTYSAVNWFFLVGALAPLLVWLTQKAFPNHKWIHLINFPILIGATRNMPPATVVNFTSWIMVGFISGFIVYRYQRVWWQQHNYVLFGALDVSLAFMGVLLYLCLGSENITLVWWGKQLT